MQIRYARLFSKQYDKAGTKIKAAFKQKLDFFLQNPFHSQLNNHALTGKLKGYRSINVTGDWRALYSQSNKTVVFEMLGTHSQLYK